ncbi:alkaline phosphatase family protein [Rhodanobacter sp. MP1X3]|uniref:LTA synthase family protein n=1 Tax=Rhodanobacter sp. MP1X3 TaxID=2723086 RepID=UPI0016074425|nr:alkaline phosphatase family protein [Rhodanobacter sp. MP1X3]MBB6240977.1 phosphoglycerol transferase MdoB-like AlkP superfamily enzyme [Rhodanobacter sp. MP1X3]
MRRLPLHFTRTVAVSLGALLLFAGCVFATAMQEPKVLQQVFVLALMLCTFGALLFVTARFATALVVCSALFAAIKFLSVLKIKYLEESLMPSDFIYYAGTSLLDTLRHYPHLYLLSIGICVVVPPLLWLVWRWDWRLFVGRRWLSALGLRMGGVLLSVLVFLICMLPNGPFAQVHNRGVWEKLSDDAQLTNFFINFDDARVHLPAMSSDAIAEQQWGSTAQGEPGSAHPPYPDIVQVLEESTFDPSIFAACGVPECRLQLFQADARTRGTGVLRTHTFGGGTWVSEFATLTGMPQDIFGPGGMYAPYVLAPHVRDALAMQLRRLGYLTIAIYPTEGSFINGRNAYKSYGFDHLYDVNELKLDEWEETDKQMFDAAKRVYDQVKKPGQPVFIMILTINQHGPHDDLPLAQLPAPFNRGLLTGLSPAATINFSAYLSRLHDSDVAMRGLEHDFLDRAQPTLLVHFGDHQPSFEGMIRPMARTLPLALQPYRDYLTYYMLKSNFAGEPLPSYPMMDIAFLPSMVLQAAGLPKDPYFSALHELRTRCNGLYDDCKMPGLIDSYHAWTFGRLHVYQ